MISQDAAWQDAVLFIGTLIPSICYFPTFLFEFPARVYLAGTPPQLEPRNKYYKQIIQDVLDSLGRDLTIDEHIIGRVRKVKEGEKWSVFDFLKSDRKEQVDAVMSRLGNQVSREIFTRWNEIFGSKFTKNIKISWSVDGDNKDAPIYLSFGVQDGASTYSIAERSLGFRWFFCFLLFTQFRKSRGGGTLFLLDEPASNLHATAQHQLLASFDAIADGENSLIYSTHSHYMINPRWLEGAFIVQNGAIEYDGELSDEREYEPHETNVRVSSYRRFVGENPDKTTYFQPILDALDYSPGILEHRSRSVMVEGKADYYTFTYFSHVILRGACDLLFLPSSGANDLGPLISLYLGWGYRFKVLLDDDKVGRRSRKRYIDEWYLDSSSVITIADLNRKHAGKSLEGLVSPEGQRLIREHMGLAKLSKKQMARFFQAKLATNEKFEFDSETIENFDGVLTEVSRGFDEEAG